jgi:hypothetical protein
LDTKHRHSADPRHEIAVFYYPVGVLGFVGAEILVEETRDLLADPTAFGTSPKFRNRYMVEKIIYECGFGGDKYLPSSRNSTNELRGYLCKNN